jgi:MarR family 2-MHQ and catechol resistance regulon transcriptional repressor
MEPRMEEEDVLEALLRSSHHVIEGVGSLLSEYDLCTTEFAVLEAVHALGPQPIQAVAARVLVTSGSMTHTVNELARKGLIRREHSREDGRTWYLHLTPQGKRLIARALKKHQAYLSAVFSPLSQKERDLLVPLLRRLYEPQQD